MKKILFVIFTISSFAVNASAAAKISAPSGGSCASPMGNIPNGGTNVGYLSPNSSRRNRCQTVNIRCENGVLRDNVGMLNADEIYASCEDASLDCHGFIDGATFFGYSTPVAPCFQVYVTCSYGTFDGPRPYDYCN